MPNKPADIATTASYQASIEGFVSMGKSQLEAEDLMRLSVRLAVEARDEFVSSHQFSECVSRIKPLIAASLGCYGAHLSNGSEYTGIYFPTTTPQTLRTFHTSRIRTLRKEPGSDILAFETIPNLLEAKAIAQICHDPTVVGTLPAWISFCCRDSSHVSSGETLADCVKAVVQCPSIVGIGVNCTHPSHVTPLITIIDDGLRASGRRGQVEILAYPNSGEEWDTGWVEGSGVEWVGMVRGWVKAGVGVVGGCCRVGPGSIARMREMLRE
ncbi:hypothetical protein HDV00_007925 [Rhizophlyctis rosea]|nr:hypothetical protein HDV00_007925 [Rhizophlyctis rosea]